MSIYNLTLDSENSLSLALDWGCNMFSWISGGKQVMYCPPDYPAAAWKITGGGNPLLFPSVGRTYDLSGVEPVLGRYSVYGDDNCYDMITHGFLYSCGWELVNETTGPESASVTFKAVIPEEIFTNRYPFRVDFIQTYTLLRNRVELTSEARNMSEQTVPAAFGYHPYFAVSNNTRKGISVELPVSRRLFTNQITQLTGESGPCQGNIDLEEDIYYDHAFDKLTGTRMTLTDSEAGRAVHVDFDPKFEMLFLYSPNSSPFVCIEPWTRGMGEFASLKLPGWQDSGSIPVIEPRQAQKYSASFTVENLTQ